MTIDSKPGSNRDHALRAQSPVASKTLSSPKVEFVSIYTREELTLTSDSNVRVHGGIPQVKKLELRSWKDLLKLIAERDGLPFIDTDDLSSSSDDEMPETSSIPALGSSSACLPYDVSIEADDSVSKVEGDDTDEVDNEAFYENHPEMRDVDMIYDREEKAHFLRMSGLDPNAHPRINAAFRSTASRSGLHSCMLRASGMI
ncbi:hypothetical protein HU230_0032800 [Bradyrhizobium quebecense]|uniref:Uncharacterized protein n=1 Tax=Bradyrhizobium quebecense TaxID=2748629 RepID=A0A973X034_9BRAD|nr:hypothetical protein [Bradyrhizobium quebecense]UGA43018.1 hypothetical protein HU230_0032800 [Bradyrhizobium quebecense]